MPHKDALRATRSNMLHDSHESILRRMQITNTTKIPLDCRKGILRGLVDLKRDKECYDFGPTQLILLDRLIKKARRLKTPEDLSNIHRLTCGLGLKNH
jgi:hypothetical protein